MYFICTQQIFERPIIGASTEHAFYTPVENSQPFGWTPVEEYHEDMGHAFWTRFPVQEPYYAGSPLCIDWVEDYYTHFIPMNIFNCFLNKDGNPK